MMVGWFTMAPCRRLPPLRRCGQERLRLIAGNPWAEVNEESRDQGGTMSARKWHDDGDQRVLLADTVSVLVLEQGGTNLLSIYIYTMDCFCNLFLCVECSQQ